MEITVRAATIADIGALVALNRLVQEMHVAHEPRYFKESDAEEVQLWFSDFLAKANGAVWVAEVGDSVAGYLAAEFRERPANPFSPCVRWCEVHQIGVDPRFRRNGIARLLMDQVVDAATRQGIGEIQLTTWDFNATAKSAFGHLGFQPSQSRMIRRITGGH